MSDIAYRYNKAKNRDGGEIPGVPLDDLTQEQFKAQPKWAQQQIEAHPMYEAAKAKPRRKASAKKKAVKAVPKVEPTPPIAEPEKAQEAPEGDKE